MKRDKFKTYLGKVCQDNTTPHSARILRLGSCNARPERKPPNPTPPPSPLQQLHVICQSSPRNNLYMMLTSPTMATLLSTGEMTGKTPHSLQIGSLPMTFAPRPSAACPTKISKEMQHAKEILGKSFYTFKFDDMIWMS
jgi:hypothetical protein